MLPPTVKSVAKGLVSLYLDLTPHIHVRIGQMSVSGDAARARLLPLAHGLALIFDLDGVVVDSMPVHTLAWRRYLETLGVNSDGVESRMHGRRNDEIVLDFIGADLDPLVVFEHGAAKERLFRELMGGELSQRMVPGAVEFLSRSQGV